MGPNRDYHMFDVLNEVSMRFHEVSIMFYESSMRFHDVFVMFHEVSMGYIDLNIFLQKSLLVTKGKLEIFLSRGETFAKKRNFCKLIFFCQNLKRSALNFFLCQKLKVYSM